MHFLHRVVFFYAFFLKFVKYLTNLRHFLQKNNKIFAFLRIKYSCAIDFFQSVC